MNILFNFLRKNWLMVGLVGMIIALDIAPRFLAVTPTWFTYAIVNSIGILAVLGLWRFCALLQVMQTTELAQVQKRKKQKSEAHKPNSKFAQIAHWMIVVALTVTFALVGLAGIGKQALVDESFWVYGRVEKFWDNVIEGDWYNARTGDNKPGITVAISAGAGLLQYDDTKALKKANLSPEERESLLSAFRIPLFVTIVLLLPIFYIVLRKLLSPWEALMSYVLITLSPLLLGMSRIVNPDALFWVLTPISLLLAISFGINLRKSGSVKYAIGAGVFLGLALLTKYTATILLLLLPILIIVSALFIKQNTNLRKYLRKLSLGYGICILVALLVIIIFYPGTWAKYDRILLVSLWSPPLLGLWKIIVITLTLAWLDIFVARTSRIAQILTYFGNLRNLPSVLLGIFGVATLTTVLFVLADAWWWQIVDYQTVIASPKSILSGLGILGLPIGIAANWYTLLFGLPTIALIGIIWFCGQLIFTTIHSKKFAQNQIAGAFLLLSIWFYYLGITVSGVIGTVRYQIITYPLALIVAGIGIVSLTRFCAKIPVGKQNDKPKNKHAVILWLALIAITVSSIYTLRNIAPYYFSYANAILPPGQVLNLKDMGDGSYQMTMYLNKLPNAKDTSIWSDKNGVCRFFLGKCTTNRKFLRQENLRKQIDYFVISTNRQTRSILINHSNPFVKELYTTAPTIHTIHLGNNPANSIRLISNENSSNKNSNTHTPKSSFATPTAKPKPINNSKDQEAVQIKTKKIATTPITIHQTVPFTSQAPLAQWSNRTFQDGCEEATLIMAMAWVKGIKSISAAEATAQIQSLSDFQQKNYGFYLDVSLVDLMRTIKDYYNYSHATLLTNPTTDELIAQIVAGKIIIVTANGKKLGNPNFRNGGPERHALLIIGYNPQTKKFITNDPGTRNGKNYQYNQNTLTNALRDYPSGDREPFPNPLIKRAIVITK